MSEPNTNTQAVEAVKQGILVHLAMPMLLFSGALFALLLLSYTVLLPRFTQFARADGTAMTPRQLIEYHKNLSAELLTKESERTEFVLAVNDASYTQLKTHKQSLSLTALDEQLKLAASRVGELAGVIVINSLSMADGKVTLSGEVSGVGPRSMTVLAEFVERVKELPIVTELDPPAFSREPDGSGDFRSPFNFSFNLVLDYARADTQK